MNPSKPVVLTSSSNTTIRHLVRMRDNRARRKAGRVLVDGWRETAQAIDAGLVLRGIYLPESAYQSDQLDLEPVARDVIRRASESGKCTHVADRVMEKISYGQSSRGVVSEFDRPPRTLAQLQLPPSPLVLVLDRIEKPGNVGAVFRCADAAGVDAVLLCESSDLFNPNAIRSSLGCVFHVPAASATEPELAQFLSSSGIRTLAARVESSQPLWSIDLSGPLAIVLGSESEGLGGRWRTVGQTPVEGVRVPMSGKVDSLNVSVCAAVIAMEAQRRRAASAGPT